VLVVIMVMMAVAQMVVNPGPVVVRAAHACPFRTTVAHLPQCSNNRSCLVERKTRSFTAFFRLFD
jgi:hypothetical protein